MKQLLSIIVILGLLAATGTAFGSGMETREVIGADGKCVKVTTIFKEGRPPQVLVDKCDRDKVQIRPPETPQSETDTREVDPFGKTIEEENCCGGG